MVNKGRSGGELLAESALDRLHHQLSQTGAFSLHERAGLHKVLVEQDLQMTDLVDPDTAVPIGKLVGVPYIVIASITQSGLEDGSFNLLGMITFAESTATCEIQARLLSVATGLVEFTRSGRAAASRSHAAVFGIGGGVSCGAMLLDNAMEKAVCQLAAELQDAAYEKSAAQNFSKGEEP